ncbi:sigma-70 family RNA polymerase sigma factor [Frankia sp. Cas3]|uniref:sigma-70 family RNA polymerase sigma factor n=1 Tax=Frankia sp. Cas3 TaxID=3073926 RepID=UPI002AD40299|nr:sigma-70 family RNA polymerase sigma factor [Frankia sp. Cas3]
MFSRDAKVTARRDEETVLRALQEEHGSAVFTYANRLTDGDRGRAEDIVQETFLRAWRRLDAVADPDRGSIRSWLLTVAHNIACDQYRARRSRPYEVSHVDVTEVPAADDIERAMERWLVADALATLSPAHRAVIVETFYRGRSVAEAAEALGVPVGTVKSRAFYGLRALKLALRERGVSR